MLLIRVLHRGYKLTISPLLAWMAGPGGGCRFEPSCSDYLVEAVETHGFARGSWLGVRRLGRCHPWGGQGIDLVPPRAEARSAKLEARTEHLSKEEKNMESIAAVCCCHTPRESAQPLRTSIIEFRVSH
jgi:putative membrane protein insertion efficiency factor